MCGIAGFTGRGRPGVLDAMVAALRHRGPDDEGTFSNEHVSLGMRRLSIMDPVGGHQPACSEDGRVMVVFNGEIYNHRELRASLSRGGHRFASQADTEVLPHLYEDDGLDFVHRLNGQFALAIWDQRRRCLVLARDRLGIKPLYVTRIGTGGSRCLVFASELKAILRGPGAERPSLNPRAIHHYLALKHCPGPETVYEGIEQLEPAHLLIWDARARSDRTRRYWDFPATVRDGVDPGEWADAVRHKLEQAVARRIVADVPVGAFLSGGLDSSSVVALYRRLAPDTPVKTFCLGYADRFENKEADLAHARALARRLGTDHYELRITAEQVGAALPELARAFDQPFAGVASTYFLSRLIAEHVKTVVSGDGSDEIFGSYLAHRLARSLAAIRTHGPTWAHARADWLGRHARDAHTMVKLAQMGEAQWRAAILPFDDAQRLSLYTPSFRQRLRDVSSGAYFQGVLDGVRQGAGDPLNRVLETDCKSLLCDQVLVFVDRLSMAHSLEVRTPFLDHELVELAMQIPGRLKIPDNGRCKHILKQAVADLVPGDILDRPKEGFVMPTWPWLAGPLRHYAASVLSAERLRPFGLLDPDAVGALVAEHVEGTADHGPRLWPLVNLQVWCETVWASVAGTAVAA